MDETLLLPLIDEDSAPFWAATRRGELRVQTCVRCGHRRFPPRPMCPSCRSTESVWPLLSGNGTIWSFVVAHPPLLPAYAELAPYNVVVVALDEDPALRMVGNVVADEEAAINSVEPSRLTIGAAVRAVFQPEADDITLPRWVLV